MDEAQHVAYQVNINLLTGMVSCWLQHLATTGLRPGSIGSSPAAALLRQHHELSYHADKDVFTQYHSIEQHEHSYTWWTFVREHGVAHKENRKPHGYQAILPELLSNLPWPVWILFVIDTEFDAAYEFTTTDESKVEALLYPERTVHRLRCVLFHLLPFYPVPQEVAAELDQRLLATLT